MQFVSLRQHQTMAKGASEEKSQGWAINSRAPLSYGADISQLTPHLIPANQPSRISIQTRTVKREF